MLTEVALLTCSGAADVTGKCVWNDELLTNQFTRRLHQQVCCVASPPRRFRWKYDCTTQSWSHSTQVNDEEQWCQKETDSDWASWSSCCVLLLWICLRLRFPPLTAHLSLIGHILLTPPRSCGPGSTVGYLNLVLAFFLQLICYCFIFALVPTVLSPAKQNYLHRTLKLHV